MSYTEKELADLKKWKSMFDHNPLSITEDKKEKVRKYVLELKAEVVAKVEEVKKENRYWFYEPSTGDVGVERMEFLRKYLKPEDIPQKMDGSLSVHLSDAPIRGASGGNQVGKTVSVVVEALMKASGVVPFCFDPTKVNNFKWKLPERRYVWKEPQFIRIISVDYQNGILKNLIPSFMKWTPKEFLLNGSWEKSYAAEKQILSIYWENKLRGNIEFMSNKQDLASFQGPPRHMLIFDEEPDYEIYKENLLRLTTAESFEVLFAMTPTNGLSWVWDHIVSKSEVQGNKVDWFKMASVCNKYANLKVLDEIMKEISVYDERRMRLLGEFVSLSGLVYGRLFDKRIHVIEPFETGCTCGRSQHDSDCPYNNYLGFMGIDAHMVKDSCAVMCFIDREDNFYVDTCYKKGVDTDELKKDLNDLMKGKRIDWSVFDPSNDSSLTVFKGVNIFKLCTTGANRISRAFKGDKFQGSIAAGVDTIKKRLKLNERTKKPSFFIFDRPENKELIRSFQTLQRESTLNEEVKGRPDKIAEGVHDHHAAMRYILQNRLKWKDSVQRFHESPIPYDEAILL